MNIPNKDGNIYAGSTCVYIEHFEGYITLEVEQLGDSLREILGAIKHPIKVWVFSEEEKPIFLEEGFVENEEGDLWRPGGDLLLASKKRNWEGPHGVHLLVTGENQVYIHVDGSLEYKDSNSHSVTITRWLLKTWEEVKQIHQNLWCEAYEQDGYKNMRERIFLKMGFSPPDEEGRMILK